MAIFFLTIYIACAYLGPTTIFGGLAVYRLQILLLAFAIITALPDVQKSPIFRSPLTFLLACFVFIVMFSIAATGWIGGTIFAANSFVPGAVVAPLILISGNSASRLRFLIVALSCVAIFIVLHGARDYYAIQPYIPYMVQQDIIGKVSPYLMPQAISDTSWIFRTRGLDFLNDPNDLAQFLVSLLPLLFFNWRPKQKARNLLLIYVPGLILIFGMYLSHSRSGMLALLGIILFSVRKKIGNTWAAALCVGLFVGAMALGWTGGRDVGMAEGQDRFEAWGVGFMLLKAHPLFGVGFDRFTDFNEITAHNSVIVCFAELGLPGYFLWIAMLARGFRNGFVVSKAAPQDTAASDQPLLSGVYVPRKMVRSPDADIILGGKLILLSLIGFACSGWFLSRAYTLTLFLLLGIAEVFYQKALERGLIERPAGVLQKIPRMAMIGAAPVVLAYLFLRVHNLLHFR